MSVLGTMATMSFVNRSQAQGAVFFANYNGGGATALVTYGAGNGANSGLAVGNDFSADLLYSIDGGVTYIDLGLGQTFPFLAPTGDTADGAGLFGSISSTVNLPAYVSGAVDFIVEAYNGSTFANSLIRGQSAVVVLSNVSTALPTGGLLSDNNFATTPLTAFTVAPVPEPTTLALAGLGGLASLVALRRKKA